MVSLNLPKSSIITIGDELISGYRADSNSKWLASQLDSFNVRVDSIVSIGDDLDRIVEELENQSAKKIDYVFITGGLGPTSDDKTLESVRKFIDSSYYLDQEYMKILNSRIKNNSKYKSMIQNQSRKINKVSYFPNPIGTALPFSFNHSNTKFFVFPGVPREFKDICKNSVFPEILNKNSKSKTINIQTSGAGETILYNKILDIQNNYISRIKFSFLPRYSGVTIRITSLENDIELLSVVKKEVISRLGKYYFATNNTTLAEFILKELKRKKLTLGIAESCTGGFISKLITDCSGSSEVYKGAIISYSNETKEHSLNIPHKMISKYGAVSKEVSELMCKNISEILKVDISISCTGISGPLGGTKEKPVGLVFISVNYKDLIFTKKFIFFKDREIHREITANTALNMLRLALLDKLD